MARPGVTKEQVFAAANAVLARGDRPTIDRVRQELGTGSPNTVNGHLDDWWSTLSKRLTDRPDNLPATVIGAIEGLYAQMLNEVRRDAEARMQIERDTLALSAQALDGRERELAARQAGFEQSAGTLRAELVASSDRAARLAAEKATLATANEDLCRRVETVEAAAGHLKDQLSEKEALHATAIARQQQQADSHQTRWLREIDALRTEVKAAKAEIQQQAKAHERQNIAQLKQNEFRDRELAAAQQALARETERYRALALKLAAAESRATQAERLVKQAMSGARSSTSTGKTKRPARRRNVESAKVVDAAG